MADLTRDLVPELVQHLDENEMPYNAIGIAVIVAGAQLRDVPCTVDELLDNDSTAAEVIEMLVDNGFLVEDEHGNLTVDPDEIDVLASPTGVAD